MISARIIADSVNPIGKRATTFVLTYPRFIHSELMTHRVFSRNAASSRAIPIGKMLKAIINEPAAFVHWGANARGMQSNGELTGWKKWAVVRLWYLGCYLAVIVSWLMSKCGAHKQLANRVTEPWAHMTTIVTGTEFGNFFNLRCHPAAQPEFQDLAFKMLEVYLDSVPKQLAWGEWHLPFADSYLAENLTTEQLLKIVTARCARVSYLNFEGEIDHEKDYGLHDDLARDGHASPFEHALCAKEPTPGQFSNALGYVQYRKMIPNENRSQFDGRKLLESRHANKKNQVEKVG